MKCLKALYPGIRKILLKIYQSTLYSYLMLHIIPYIRFTLYYTSFKGWKYHRGYKILQPGDFILSTDKWKLTSLLIPGEWSHASLCVSKDKEFEVAEMTHTNFTKSTFFDICKESTRVAIYRCDDWDTDYIQNVIKTCLSFENTEYDVSFEYGVKALYCSELVISSDPEKRLNYNDEDLMNIGRPYISPTGLSKSTNSTKMWDSNNERKEN